MKSSILDIKKVQEFAKEHKLQPFRVKQIYHEIFKNQNIEFSEMTTLSKELRDQLDQYFFVSSLKIDKIMEDDNTTKVGFRTQDGHIIESVILSHRAKRWNEKLNRITLCISSQIGCPINCLFCVTWKMGFKRNLTRDEIISQILVANHLIKQKMWKKSDQTLFGVRNVVFMWMGEPLLNYENVRKSIEIMLRQEAGLSLSKRHITISTAGIIPWIQQLIKDDIQVKLAISLHAPNQTLRDQLMPIAKAYPLDALMKVIDQYVRVSDNRIFYEYIMIKNVTDKPELAQQLAALLKGKLAHINLIPYNANPLIKLQESDETTIRKFQETLEKLHMTVTVRDSMGRKVKSACWQLGYEAVQKKDEDDDDDE